MRRERCNRSQLLSYICKQQRRKVFNNSVRQQVELNEHKRVVKEEVNEEEEEEEEEVEEEYPQKNATMLESSRITVSRRFGLVTTRPV